MYINKIVSTVCALFLLAIIWSCEKDKFTDPNDPRFGAEEVEPVPGENDTVVASIHLEVDASDQIEISPKLFGINNDWSKVTDAQFESFANAANELGNSILRYPGGWESEYYDWNTNSTPNWNNTPNIAGASVTTMKNNIGNYGIVVPTVNAMNENLGSAAFTNAIAELKTITKNAITLADPDKIEIVEIGNEWWLQWGGGVSRVDKLEKYTKIAVELAAFIQETFPGRDFKLLVNGDYTQPVEFTTMKELFTSAYDAIDGVALHTYTGYQSDTHNISDLKERIMLCASNFNPDKHYVYLSEWMPSRDYNERRLYMEAANLIPDIVHIYARAGADAAAFWPPINSSIPGLGLFNVNFNVVFPVGQIFSELSRSYTGMALKTVSDKAHIAAAQNDPETLTLFITGGSLAKTDVAVNIKNFEIGEIASAEKFYPSDYAETNKAAPYKTGTTSISLNGNHQLAFDINAEGKYQIFKIVLKK